MLLRALALRTLATALCFACKQPSHRWTKRTQHGQRRLRNCGEPIKHAQQRNVCTAQLGLNVLADGVQHIWHGLHASVSAQELALSAAYNILRIDVSWVCISLLAWGKRERGGGGVRGERERE